MRTTLKRGIGRATGGNGNGRAVLPPAIFSPVRRYRQPFTRRGAESALIALLGAVMGALLGVGLAAAVAQAVEHGHVTVGLPLKLAAGAVAVVLAVALASTTLARRAARLDRRSPRWERIALGAGWVCAFALIVDVGSAGGAYLYYHQSVAAVVAHSKDVKLAAKHLDIPLPNEPAIALVIGYDRRYGETDRGRSDTIMLLRADPTTKSISMLSFPRDLTTTLWCGNKIVGNDRINTAYTLCGSKGALDTVKRLTGLPINYLITVDFGGFIEIVDRIGGVWVDIDRRYYNKNTGQYYNNYANIDLKPGYQLLKGRDALSYVRYRHTDSDLYRIARQQQFVKAFKQQITHHFSVWKVPKLVGAITHNVEIGQAGGGSLESTIRRYALFAYGLPSGNFFQSKIQNLTGTNELSASPSDIAAAVHDFETPDVQAPQKATAVAFGRKAAGIKAPVPSHVTIDVLNGNGVTGSASSAAYELGQRSYRIVVPASSADRNAPTFDYFHTMVYYDPRKPGAKAAARKVADLFGDGEVERLPAKLRAKAEGAMLTVVVGSTFHGTIAPAPADTTPKKQPAYVRSDPSQSESPLRAVRRRMPFPLMVPTVVERSSYIDREQPIRAYELTKGEPAVRLTFLASDELAGYWGIEETAWKDAPVLQQPNFKHVIGGRKYAFYYDGAHLHMVVLRTGKASYWVVNTLLDSLSNETMIEIAKGLKPLSRG
jgi:LCP family protein required for cell wall assembly